LSRLATPKYPGDVRLRAFTLIELLLVLAMIALLVTLLMGHLAESRRMARRVRTLASLNSCAQIFHAYCNDWRDSWPAFADPGPNPTTLRLGNNDTIDIPLYFLSCFLWPYALGDGYFEGNYDHPAMFPAESIRYVGGTDGSPFLYPCVYLADPGFWRSETRVGSSQWRGTFRHEVFFPSNKSLLVTSFWSRSPEAVGVPNLNSPRLVVPVASADASARAVPWKAFREGYFEGEGLEPGTAHPFDAFVAMHTVGGLRGRDY